MVTEKSPVATQAFIGSIPRRSTGSIGVFTQPFVKFDALNQRALCVNQDTHLSQSQIINRRDGIQPPRNAPSEK
jgi:hypothetical protein